MSKTVTPESKRHHHPPKLASQVSNQVTSTTSAMVHQADKLTNDLSYNCRISQWLSFINAGCYGSHEGFSFFSFCLLKWYWIQFLFPLWVQCKRNILASKPTTEPRESAPFQAPDSTQYSLTISRSNRTKAELILSYSWLTARDTSYKHQCLQKGSIHLKIIMNNQEPE